MEITNAPRTNAQPKKTKKPITINTVIVAIIVVIILGLTTWIVINALNAKSEERKAEEQAQFEADEKQAYADLTEGLSAVVSNTENKEEELKSYEEKVKAFIEKYDGSEDDIASAALYLGMAYYSTGDVDKAIDWYNEILTRENMTSNGKIIIMMQLADYYGASHNIQDQAKTLQAILDLPEHKLLYMTWEGGVEDLIKSQLESLGY